MILNKLSKINIIQLGLYVLVFLLPLQSRWMFKLGQLHGQYWGYGTYSLYLIDILLILLFIIWLTINLSTLKFYLIYIRYYAIWTFITFLELFVFISLLFASNLPLAFYGYLRFLLALLLLFLIITIKSDIIKIYWSMVAAGVIQSLLALWQFFTQHVFANKWLGMAAQDPSILGASVIEANGSRWLRAYGSLSHPNILGGYLALVLIINIALYIILWNNKHNNQKRKHYIIVALVSIMLNTAGLLLTFSRSAWVACVIGVSLLVIWSVEKYHKQGMIIMTKALIIISVVTLLFINIMPTLFQTRLEYNARLEQQSIMQRINYNKDAWQIIKRHWFTGVGIKNYGINLIDSTGGHRSVYEYEPVHNVLLLVWAEIGVGGIIIFVSMLIYLFTHYVNGRNYLSASLIFTLTILLIFDHWLWSMAFGVYLFWLILGLSIRNNI